jgi:tetratricopeptide (TPR) repeat protein
MNAPPKGRDLICAFICSCLVLLSDAKGDLNADAKSLYWEGYHLEEQGTRESLLKAIEKYKEALRLFQQLGDIFNQGMTLNGMGHSYAGLGDLQSAVTCFEQDAQFEEQLKYYGNEGVTLVDLGYTYLQRANLEKASAAFQRARALLYTEAERDSLYYKDIADALDGLGQTEDKRGNAKSALAYMTQAADAARKFGNKTTLAKKLGAAGIMAQKLGQFDLAEPLLTEVLALWQELGSKDNQGMALHFLAKCREGKGDYRGAIDYYRKKAAIQHELNLIRNEANTYVDMALLAQKIPDLDQALTYFEQAKSLFGDAVDKHSQAILHFYVGVVYSQRKDLERAIGELKPAADLFAELTDTADEATARLAWADAIYQNSGTKQEAIDQYSKAADLFQKLNKPGTVASCDGKVAQLLTDLGKIDEAIVIYRQAISLLETTPDNQELGQDWFGLGWIYQRRGDRSEELAAFSRAQPYLKKANDTLREGIVLLRLSSIYTEEVQIEKALFYDRRAAELFRQIGNQPAEAESLYGVAVGTLYLGKPRDAIEAAQQAIVIWKQLNDVKQLGACLLILGRAKLNSGDGSFLQDLEDSVRYSKSASDLLTEAEALSNLGLAYTLADHFNEAQQDFDDALQLVRKKTDSKLEGQILANLGLTYLFRGDRQTAIDYLINAIRLLHSVGDHSGEADTLNTLGLLYSQLGDDDQGLSYFQRALGLYRDLNDIRRQGLALNGIGVLLIRLQRNDEALNYFQQAAHLTVNLDKLEDVKLQTEQNIAFAMDLVGEHQDAQKRYLSFLATAHDSGNRRLEANILGNLGTSYLKTADYENARRHSNNRFLCGR